MWQINVKERPEAISDEIPMPDKAYKIQIICECEESGTSDAMLGNIGKITVGSTNDNEFINYPSELEIEIVFNYSIDDVAFELLLKRLLNNKTTLIISTRDYEGETWSTFFVGILRNDSLMGQEFRTINLKFISIITDLLTYPPSDTYFSPEEAYSFQYYVEHVLESYLGYQLSNYFRGGYGIRLTYEKDGLEVECTPDYFLLPCSIYLGESNYANWLDVFKSMFAAFGYIGYFGLYKSFCLCPLFYDGSTILPIIKENLLDYYEIQVARKISKLTCHIATGQLSPKVYRDYVYSQMTFYENEAEITHDHPVGTLPGGGAWSGVICKPDVGEETYWATFNSAHFKDESNYASLWLKITDKYWNLMKNPRSQLKVKVKGLLTDINCMGFYCFDFLGGTYRAVQIAYDLINNTSELTLRKVLDNIPEGGNPFL